MQDVGKYGYAFLAFSSLEEPEKIDEIGAFKSTADAMACCAIPDPEKIKLGIAIQYLDLETAKNALLKGKCSLFSTRDDLKHHKYLGPDPENKDYLAFLKGWFAAVEDN